MMRQQDLDHRLVGRRNPQFGLGDDRGVAFQQMLRRDPQSIAQQSQHHMRLDPWLQ